MSIWETWSLQTNRPFIDTAEWRHLNYDPNVESREPNYFAEDVSIISNAKENIPTMAFGIVTFYPLESTDGRPNPHTELYATQVLHRKDSVQLIGEADAQNIPISSVPPIARFPPVGDIEFDATWRVKKRTDPRFHLIDGTYSAVEKDIEPQWVRVNREHEEHVKKQEAERKAKDDAAKEMAEAEQKAHEERRVLIDESSISGYGQEAAEEAERKAQRSEFKEKIRREQAERDEFESMRRRSEIDAERERAFASQLVAMGGAVPQVLLEVERMNKMAKYVERADRRRNIELVREKLHTYVEKHIKLQDEMKRQGKIQDESKEEPLLIQRARNDVVKQLQLVFDEKEAEDKASFLAGEYTEKVLEQKHKNALADILFAGEFDSTILDIVINIYDQHMGNIDLVAKDIYDNADKYFGNNDFSSVSAYAYETYKKRQYNREIAREAEGVFMSIEASAAKVADLIAKDPETGYLKLSQILASMPKSQERDNFEFKVKEYLGLTVEVDDIHQADPASAMRGVVPAPEAVDVLGVRSYDKLYKNMLVLVKRNMPPNLYSEEVKKVIAQSLAISAIKSKGNQAEFSTFSRNSVFDIVRSYSTYLLNTAQDMPEIIDEVRKAVQRKVSLAPDKIALINASEQARALLAKEDPEGYLSRTGAIQDIAGYEKLAYEIEQMILWQPTLKEEFEWGKETPAVAFFNLLSKISQLSINNWDMALSSITHLNSGDKAALGLVYFQRVVRYMESNGIGVPHKAEFITRLQKQLDNKASKRKDRDLVPEGLQDLGFFGNPQAPADHPTSVAKKRK